MSTATQQTDARQKYPDRAEIFKLFEHLGKGEYDEFFARVDDGVDWTIMGELPVTNCWRSDAKRRHKGASSW